MTTRSDNTPSTFAARALDLVTALRKIPEYAKVISFASSIKFEGAPTDDRERVVLCEPSVQKEVQLMFPEIGKGIYTRIRLSMPKEAVTLQNIDDVTVEMFLTNDDGVFLRRESRSLTGLPTPLRFAVEAEMFHHLTQHSSAGVRVSRNKLPQ